MEQNDHRDLSESLGPAFVAQQSFEKSLNSEMAHAKDVKLSSLSIVLGPSFPKRPLFNHCKNPTAEHYCIPYINLPILRQFSIFFGTLWAIFTRLPVRSKIDIMYLATSYAPVTLGAKIASRFNKAKTVLTLTDLASFSYRSERVSQMSHLHQRTIKSYRRFAKWVESSADAYVLFSSGMQQAVNFGKAPFIIMEGMFTAGELNVRPNPALSEPIIAHAGTLNRQYGIAYLLDSFEQVKAPGAQLWLIGSGDMDDEITARSQGDTRIKFLGFRPRDEVFTLLSQARLLINLRDPRDEYTKHSFPSKVFEYLVSGVPLASTRLDGIPGEYFSYIIPLESKNAASTALEIEDILKESTDALKARGIQGRNFVLNHKNPNAQTSRVLEFLHTLK